MKEQIAIQKLLITKYEELRLRNPQFSRRAFSRRLGLSAGAISELFNGRRQGSLKLAEKIANRLALDPLEREHLLSAFLAKKATPQALIKDEGRLDYLQLSADQFHLVGDWYHFAILTLMRTKRFKSDIAWIANRLGLSKNIVHGAIERLKRLGLVKEDKRGRWTRSKTRYRTTDDVPNESVRRAHGQYLDKARTALETLPVDQRDFTWLLLTLDIEQLPRAKQMIREFQDKFERELGKHEGSEVFQLCMQLFPITIKGDL